jgi:hypothetical protein
MLISENELEELIKEEIERAIEEGWLDRMFASGAGLKSKLASKASSLGAKAARGLGSTTAAADMEAAAASRGADAAAAKKLGLMKSHAQNFDILSKSMIKDAQKLDLLGDPNFKKALAAAKAVATRMNNIVAAWEKAPEKIPGAEAAPEGGGAGAPPASGDTVQYTDAKGRQKTATVVKILDTKDSQGDPQIQLKVGGAVFAVDQKAVKKLEDDIPTQVVPKDDLDKAVAARQAAGSPPISEILKRIIREELESLSE